MDGKHFLRDDLLNYKPASNLHFNERIKELQKSGKSIFHMGFGQSPFPIPQFAQQRLREHADNGLYLPSRGILELREAICALHKREDNLEHFYPEYAVVGPGSKELIFLLLCITGGDVVLLSPTWTTYKPQGILSKHKVIVIPTKFNQGWKLTPDDLEKAFHENSIRKNSILVFCNPDNPTGAAYTDEELKKLSEVMRKHGLLVVSDEIYSRLSFNNNHVSLAKHYPEATILSSGISKWASCGGWRLGYHLFPSQLSAVSAAVASAASQTYTCASAPVQYAAVRLFQYDDHCKSYVAHCSRILCAVATFCCSTLREVGVKVHMSSSGYYVFPDFDCIRSQLAARGIQTGDQMCDAILKETNVALMAGGPSYLHPEEELTMRLCYINFDGAAALKVSETIGLKKSLPERFVQEHCAPTYEAINLLAKWISDQRVAS